MSQRLVIGLVGAGAIARDHALVLSRQPAVTGLICYDADAGRAAELAAKFGARVAATQDELMRDADLVWISTPPFVREEPIAAACAAGKPIFCEKPLGLDLANVARISAMVAAAGVPFFMGQSGRYSYFFQKMKALVAEGAIGAPRRVWSIRQGRLDPAKTVPWRLKNELSGGVVAELGVHELDFIRWIGGDWLSVCATLGTTGLVPGYEDTLDGIGKLASGAQASVHLSWADPRYLWQRGVEGETGSLFFDDSAIMDIVLQRPGKDPQIFKTGDWLDRQTGENLAFREQAIAVLGALLSGAPPPVSLADGAAAARTAHALRTAAHTGLPVPVPLG